MLLALGTTVIGPDGMIMKCVDTIIAGDSLLPDEISLQLVSGNYGKVTLIDNASLFDDAVYKIIMFQAEVKIGYI